MRILCIGVSGLPSGVKGDLTTAHVLQDYDAVVVDPLDLKTLYPEIWRRVSEYHRVGAMDSSDVDTATGEKLDRWNKKRSQEAKGLLGRGGVLAWLMRPIEAYRYKFGGEYKVVSNYDWLMGIQPLDDYILNLHDGHGTTVDITDSNHPVSEYLGKEKPSWTAYLGHTEYKQWKVLAQAYGSHDIALTCRVGRGHIVALPSGACAYKHGELLEQCISKLLKQEEPRDKPAWVERIQPPEQRKILERMGVLDTKMSELRKQRDELAADNEKWERWKWLLWETGKHHLEPVVREAVALIGCQVEPQPDKDSDGKVDSEFGPALLEVEGTVRSVTRDKLGQLVVNVGNFLKDKSISAKGIFVGNPFCRKPLDDRPPKGTQKNLFAKELIQDAEKHNITVLLSTDLYDVVCRILEGQVSDDEKKRLRQAIFEGKGFVELAELLPPSNAQLG